MSRPDPYSEFRKNSEGDPYAEFRRGAMDAPAVAPAERTAMDSAVDFGKAAIDAVNPLPGLQALYQEGPVGVLHGMSAAQGEQFTKAKQAFDAGDYSEAVRYTIGWLIPVLGPQISAAGDKMNEGKYAEGMGAATGIGFSTAASMRVPGPKQPSAKLVNAATDVYEQAIKPGVQSQMKTTPAQLRATAQTGLAHGIAVSEAGAAKLAGLIDDLDNTIAGLEGQASQRGLTVNKFDVAKRLNDTARKFERQATPQSDLQAISEAGNDFLEAQPGQMSVSDAAAIKRGTYQQLKSKSFGEMKTARIEAEKALARGIKEEIGQLVPAIADLNAAESTLIKFDQVLQRAVNKAANSRSGGLKDILYGGAGAVMSGSTVVGAGTLLLRHLWGDPAFKSAVANAIYQAQKAKPLKYGQPNLGTAMAKVNAIWAALNPANQRSGQSAETPGATTP